MQFADYGLCFFKGSHNFRKAEQPDHDRNQGKTGHKINITERKPGNALQTIEPDQRGEQAQNTGNPAFQRIPAGSQLSADHNAEYRQQKELPRAKFQRKTG